MKGHLYLDLPADPFLATLANPWAYAERSGHGLHDASYFQGHYYLYFGVTPVVVLFLPIRLLTGLEVDQAAASFLFALAGLVASTWLLWRVRERFFPSASLVLTGALGLGLGLTTTMPLLLRRANLWEVPITCAYACFSIAVCFLYGSLTSSRRNLLLAGASLVLGLAVGARPTYLFGCLALLVPLALWAREAGGVYPALRQGAWRRSAACALLPAAIVGLLLAAYNLERFGRVTEFGQRYQMSGDDSQAVMFFNWRFPLYGLRVYGLLPAHWSPYFPFVSAADIPPRPAGQLGVEDPYGILPNIPFVLMALGLVALGRTRKGLGAFALALGVATAATGLTVMAFGGITNRYMVDFVPGLSLLASIGTLAVCQDPRGRPRIGVAALALGLLLYSALFNILASVRHNELFRAEHPKAYARLVHAGNRLAFAIDPWFNPKGYGDLELRLMIPPGKPGTIEPLVVTGTTFLSDYLVVRYEGKGTVVFGLVHTNYPLLWGTPVTLDPDVPHTLIVGMGSLYPPAAHPYFDGIDPLFAHRIQETIKVAVDGTTVLETATAFYDASSYQPRIGASAASPAFPLAFSGKVLSVARIPPLRFNSSGGASHVGPVEFKLKVPPFTGRRSEPLLCTGVTGRGDLVFITYTAADRIVVGLDHWGHADTETRELAIDPTRIQTIRIDYPSLHPGSESAPESKEGTPGRLVISVNGRTEVDLPRASYRCLPDQIAEGVNTIETSTAQPKFTGEIVGIRYLGKSRR